MKSLLPILVFVLSISSLRAEPKSEVCDLSAYFETYATAFVLLDAKKDRWIRYHPELCAERATPCSTFKIPNALVALETGVASGPDFALKWDGTKYPIEAWNQDQTLRSAFSVSCVWFFKELARRTGQERMDSFVTGFHYGNADISGGLTSFWLESSLKISPDEQVDFLRRLHSSQLPVSDRALNQLLDIMVVSRVGGTIYRGKTGTAGSAATGATRGWWVGSVVVGSSEYYFTTCITGGENPSGREARRMTESVLRDWNILPPPE